MQKSWYNSGYAFFLIIFITIFLVGAQEYALTVTGTLFTPDIDEDIEITKAGIVVEEEDGYYYYYLTPDEKGRELYDLIDKKVIITGTLSSDKYENQWITVKSWKLVKTK